MSKLAAMMAKRKVARDALQPTKIVSAVASLEPKVIVEPKELAAPSAEELGLLFQAATLTEAVEAAAKPTAFKLGARTTVGSLNEISTKITECLSEAEQKVAEQEAKGVYKLPEAATVLMGEQANELIGTMQALDAALVDKTPEIRTLSAAIRKNLEQFPELTHILSDDQLHIMIQGYLTIANVKTAPKTKAAQTAQANKKADAKIKSLAGKSVDELF